MGRASDPLADYELINRELAQFSQRLAAKPQIVVLNKMDLPDAQAWWPLVEEEMDERNVEVHAISAVSKEGVRPLMQRTSALLQALPPPEPEPDEIAVFRPAEREDAFTVEERRMAGACGACAWSEWQR